MRKLLLPALVTVSLLFVPSRASADLIGYNFNGVVTGTFDNLGTYMPGIDVGTSLTGRVVFSTTGGLESAFNFLEMYVGDFRASSATFFGGVSGNLGSFTISGFFPIEGPLTKNIGGDYLVLQFDLADTTSPVGSLLFYGLDHTCFCGFDDTPGFNADITSVTQVPDSGSTLLLFAFGLTALIGCHQLRFSGSVLR